MATVPMMKHGVQDSHCAVLWARAHGLRFSCARRQITSWLRVDACSTIRKREVADCFRMHCRHTIMGALDLPSYRSGL
eukprot:COSAG03_NODE_1024_length_5000_cov_3.947562_2_plen_78_part_00